MLRFTLKKYAQDLYVENYKMLMKEIKEDKKWKFINWKVQHSEDVRSPPKLNNQPNEIHRQVYSKIHVERYRL